MDSHTFSNTLPLPPLVPLTTIEYHLSVNNILAALLKHADPDEARLIVASELNLGHIQAPEFLRRHSDDNVLSVAAWMKSGWGFEIGMFTFSSFQVLITFHAHLTLTFSASHNACALV